MLKLIATTALVLSACIGDGLGGDPGPLPVEDGKEFDPATEPDDNVQTFVGEETPDNEIDCALLPEGDDACAHACDPDGLVSYIPAGTCVKFECELTDGRPFTTGGCNI
ncbi:MAG: hypothetical protein HOV81_33095 [Kofleriaceae bacterium]|nr:hypothetical protein [Kofleriaceae bacterium]